MFIELHKLEYFVPAREDNHTMVSLPDYNGWLYIKESYEQVKELIKECQMK